MGKNCNFCLVEALLASINNLSPYFLIASKRQIILRSLLYLLIIL